MSSDPRLPCLVGTARRTWHPGQEVPEPLAMWEQVARDAARDAGAVELLRRVDDLGVVHCQSWAYDDPAARLAQRLDLSDPTTRTSILAGTAPQRLIDSAATRMLRGECEVALVVGGEALSTRRRHDAAGETPPWSHPHPDPPTLPVDLDEWYLPTEIAHGVLPAWLTFALLEQARWAARGGTPEARHELHRTMSELNAVAATNPDAWFRDALAVEEIVRPSADNRMVATPYTKRMTAYMDVDMAAANLLVTSGVADELGIPAERRVHLRGWGFARDAVHVGARRELDRSPAMVAATSAAMTMAGTDVDSIDLFDLYSCFGSAVQFARDALGLSAEDTRPFSVTGGLPYHGGPSSNYMGHSISHMVDRLRADDRAVGMTTGVGMHMTKHVAAVWSARPGPLPVPPTDHEQHWDAPASVADVSVAAAVTGCVVVLAATVVHDRDGSPSHVVAICRTEQGHRCYALSRDPEVIDAVTQGLWVGREAELRETPDGTNQMRWAAPTTRRQRRPAAMA